MTFSTLETINTLDFYDRMTVAHKSISVSRRWCKRMRRELRDVKPEERAAINTPKIGDYDAWVAFVDRALVHMAEDKTDEVGYIYR